MADVSCPGCNKRYSVPEEKLGRTVRCKGCGTQFTLQLPVDDAEVPLAEEPPVDILAALSPSAAAAPTDRGNANAASSASTRFYSSQITSFDPPPAAPTSSGSGVGIPAMYRNMSPTSRKVATTGAGAGVGTVLLVILIVVLRGYRAHERAEQRAERRAQESQQGFVVQGVMVTSDANGRPTYYVLEADHTGQSRQRAVSKREFDAASARTAALMQQGAESRPVTVQVGNSAGTAARGNPQTTTREQQAATPEPREQQPATRGPTISQTTPSPSPSENLDWPRRHLSAVSGRYYIMEANYPGQPMVRREVTKEEFEAVRAAEAELSVRRQAVREARAAADQQRRAEFNSQMLDIRAYRDDHWAQDHLNITNEQLTQRLDQNTETAKRALAKPPVLTNDEIASMDPARYVVVGDYRVDMPERMYVVTSRNELRLWNYGVEYGNPTSIRTPDAIQATPILRTLDMVHEPFIEVQFHAPRWMYANMEPAEFTQKLAFGHFAPSRLDPREIFPRLYMTVETEVRSAGQQQFHIQTYSFYDGARRTTMTATSPAEATAWREAIRHMAESFRPANHPEIETYKLTQMPLQKAINDAADAVWNEQRMFRYAAGIQMAPPPGFKFTATYHAKDQILVQHWEPPATRAGDPPTGLWLVVRPRLRNGEAFPDGTAIRVPRTPDMNLDEDIAQPVVRASWRHVHSVTQMRGFLLHEKPLPGDTVEMSHFLLSGASQMYVVQLTGVWRVEITSHRERIQAAMDSIRVSPSTNQTTPAFQRRLREILAAME